MPWSLLRHHRHHRHHRLRQTCWAAPARLSLTVCLSLGLSLATTSAWSQGATSTPTPAAATEAATPAAAQPASVAVAVTTSPSGSTSAPLTSSPPAKASARANAKLVKPQSRPKAARSAPDSNDSEPDTVTYGRRTDAMALASALAARFGLDEAAAQAALAQARFVPSVARLIMPAPAGTAKNWAAYRARFVEPQRIRAGVAFWAANAAWLAAAEQRYGVPASVITGIIGVETFYGRVTGNYRVLDALASLSLDFPTGRSDRRPFFQDELGQFLKLTQAERLDPTSVKGSFAGAIGLGQFMPGSINRFAVDFDGDGRIDMANSAADVIGSAAHYLAEHGWRRGEPSHFAVKPPVDSSDRAALLLPDILPSFSAAQMTARCAVLDPSALAHPGLLALVELQNGDAAPSYVAGTQNFYAITRYNASSYYALAVIELGQAVAAARGVVTP